MKFIPHEYQQKVLEHVLNTPKAGLFLDMGLGKTVITLTAIAELIPCINKVLVIAPLRVAQDTWSREHEKWDHLEWLKISKVLGTAKQRVQGLEQDADIYIINRENVPWLIDHLGGSWDFDMVVIDELSSFKSAKAERFRALKKVIGFCDRVVGLTGTPTPNGLTDLWPQLYLLDQGERLGRTVSSYRMRYFIPVSTYGHIVLKYGLREGAKEAIHSKVADICISMTAKDWLQLPERIDIKRYVYLTENERREYEAFVEEAYLEYEQAEVVALSAAALVNKLLQYSNGAMYHGDKGEYVIVNDHKLDALEEIIDSANGKSVLVFYSYKHDVERIRARVKSAKLLDIEAWNKGEIPVMVCHPASAGHGLNLQDGGSVIVWFGLPWSLELYQQANARLHRQGQKEAVIVHHLMTAETYDDAVYTALQSKCKVQDSLIQSLKGDRRHGES